MKPDILLGLSQYNRLQLVSKGAAVKDAMNATKSFPTLKTAIAEYTKAYDDFVASIPAPNVSNKVNEGECDIKCEAFEIQYTSLGNYVRAVAKGNEELLRESGYPLKQKPQPWPIPKTPSGVDAFAMIEFGKLLVTCNTEKYVKEYVARVSMDRTNWIENFETAARIVLKNVPTGVTLYVQMQTKNSTGESAWSPIMETRLPAENEPLIKHVNA